MEEREAVTHKISEKSSIDQLRHRFPDLSAPRVHPAPPVLASAPHIPSWRKDIVGKVFKDDSAAPRDLQDGPYSRFISPMASPPPPLDCFDAYAGSECSTPSTPFEMDAEEEGEDTRILDSDTISHVFDFMDREMASPLELPKSNSGRKMEMPVYSLSCHPTTNHGKHHLYTIDEQSIGAQSIMA